jgi:hypothetical protein
MRRFYLAGLVLALAVVAHAQDAQKSVVASQNGSGTKDAGSIKPATVSAAKFAIPPEKAQPVSVIRFDSAPTIDGRLDDEVWKSAAVLKDFLQIQPGDNIAPSQPSEVKIGYDAKHFYIAFRCFEERDKVRVTISKRDQIFQDDYVGLYIDTFDDKRKAYALFFNPLGIQADGIFTEGSGEDYSLDIVMESKGIVMEDGYTIEIAVPFKSLRFEAGKGKFWGLHLFRRVQHRDRELNSWMPVSRDISGSLVQAGRITGFEEIATERNLEIIPTLTISESGRRVRSIPFSTVLSNPGLVDSGRFVNSPVDFDPGINVKFGITQSLTLDFTANPDFAQVEADQIVVTANQRFPIFFPERRPFFLEGIDIFQTSLQPVHTRAIVDPDYAVKLSGKQGRTTLGLMLASDNAPGNFSEEERADPNLLPRIGKFFDKNAYIGVLRLKRDIGKESSLGLIGTSYNFIEKHNQLAGFDGRFRVDSRTTMHFQVLGTTSRRFFYDPELDRNLYRTGNGLGYTIGYNYNGRHLSYELYGQGRTSDYRADVGFTPRTNTNFNSFFIGYNTEPKPQAKHISTHYHNFTHIDYDFQGRIQIWESEFIAEWQFARQTWLGVGYERAYERLFEEEFGPVRTASRPGAFIGDDAERSSNKHHYFFFGGTRPNKQFAADFRFVYRDGHFDFDFGAGPKFPRVSPAALVNSKAPLDPGRGGLFEFRGGVSYQPSSELRAALNYTKNRLRRFDTDRVAFDDNIYSLSVVYQFTRASFARVLLDYTTLSSRVRGQYLFGWTPSPGTSFYAGYNDSSNWNGFSPFSLNKEPGYHINTRTFFVKMSYLIRRSL